MSSGSARKRSWVYFIDGQMHGPIAARELKQLAADGTITRRTLVKAEGMTEPGPAGRIKGLFPEEPHVPDVVPKPEATSTTPTTSQVGSLDGLEIRVDAPAEVVEHEVPRIDLGSGNTPASKPSDPDVMVLDSPTSPPQVPATPESPSMVPPSVSELASPARQSPVPMTPPTTVVGTTPDTETLLLIAARLSRITNILQWIRGLVFILAIPMILTLVSITVLVVFIVIARPTELIRPMEEETPRTAPDLPTEEVDEISDALEP